MSGYQGALNASDTATDFSAHQFQIAQMLATVNVAALVKVVSVTSNGAVAPGGRVDVQPLVGMIDGAGNVTPHGVVHGLVYGRVQAGGNAVIMDPVVGDVGVAVFCHRDSSAAIVSGKPSPPGSRRKFDWADGVYLMGILGAAPMQYVQFSASGITINSPNEVSIVAPAIKTTGTLTNNGVNVGSTHVHGGVTTGGGDTGTPV